MQPRLQMALRYKTLPQRLAGRYQVSKVSARGHHGGAEIKSAIRPATISEAFGTSIGGQSMFIARAHESHFVILTTYVLPLRRTISIELCRWVHELSPISFCRPLRNKI